MWDVSSKTSLGTVETPVAPVHALAFAPSGRMFAAGCAAGHLVLYANRQSPADSAAASAPAATDAAVIGAGGVFAPESVVIRHHIADVRCVAFSAEGDFLLSGSDDRSIKMFSVAPFSDQPLRYECVRTFDGHQGPVYSLAIGAQCVGVELHLFHFSALLL
jgi:WD40 repeat protein